MIKLLSNDFRKGRPLQRYFILEILTNPAKVTNKKPTNILGKNPEPLSLFNYSYPSSDKISSLSGKLASHKSTEKRTIKRGTKLDIEKERNRNWFTEKKIGLCACTKNDAQLHPISRNIYHSCFKPHFQPFPYLLMETRSKKEELVKRRFFPY